MKHRRGWAGLFLVLWLGGLPVAQAQPDGRRFGLGAQIGTPAGLTIKFYRVPPPSGTGWRPDALTLLAAWNRSAALRLHAYLTGERPIPDSPLRYFAGPGLVLGLAGTRPDADLLLGAGGTFGVNFFRERFEVYLLAAPRLNLLPGLRGVLDAGVGLRYYF
ncbi:hypothetical protein GQ464_004960 [Rhodocaloribacter litoris]|uniref:hypothetical protein n=1 Tax=Rhodocaloribacter litoris TaxID=2558931 RepID=UPI001423F39D|nr:hypothetical protein [Rhodocaloribacter litoris]QXD16307.1 hypothetical protein GQ464_004960 [Rhodocaloribacter litoris]GIV60871.1 MAG: RNA polymerase subunit sigma-54 [Rhodothermaceae bacterium]